MITVLTSVFYLSTKGKLNSIMNRSETINVSLKIELMESWIESEWISQRLDQDVQTVMISQVCVDNQILQQVNREQALAGTHMFAGAETFDCPVIAQVSSYSQPAHLSYRTGASLFRFAAVEAGATIDILVMASYYTDQGHMACLAAVPCAYLPVWTAFASECQRLAHAMQPSSRVEIIGGRSTSFEPTVEWDDVVLPDALKADLLHDVSSFFAKGVDVYKRLKLKPFRKLLLAGVPGTGKTMLCSALAKWALDQQFLVIYISSADQHGATFWKIEQALAIASNSSIPTLIILEELDAYLHGHEKAMVLNVLDGSESRINDRGTLLISTTNYPEAIDERVLKRPGRLDRIFIIPEARTAADAEQMLKLYLGDLWQDEHRKLVPQLVGYPGAFVREVSVYALTQVAFDDLTELPLALLEESFNGLKDQIDARDSFFNRQAEQPAYPNGH